MAVEITTEPPGRFAMKTLYLMRHAKSSWKDPELEDHQRPLNKRGKRDAPVMGKRLKKRSPHIHRIVSSDALRAVDTANPVCQELGLDTAAIQLEPRLYHAPQDQILDIIKQFENDWQQVLLVGHNPGLQDVANLFYAPRMSKLPTAGIVTLMFDIETWKDVDPKKLIYSDFDFPKKKADGKPSPKK